MTNPNDPAHPCSMPVMAKKEDGLLHCVGETPRSGITIREYFAAMAMQGVLTWDSVTNGKTRQFTTMPKLAECCVAMADSLIAELNKEKS